jgi:general secretion pathway protein G
MDYLAKYRRAREERGFTLIELMIVVTIIMILLGMAAVRYERSVQQAREAVLKSDLRTMRDAIQQYTLDKQDAPQSIDDLVSAGYLREVPTDPITRTREWHADFDNVLLSPDQSNAGMSDVHSTSDALSLEGTPYNTW